MAREETSVKQFGKYVEQSTCRVRYHERCIEYPNISIYEVRECVVSCVATEGIGLHEAETIITIPIG